MAILVAKVLHLLSPKRNERILYLFQMLIMHRPGNLSDQMNFKSDLFFLALVDLRISFAQYLQSFDDQLGQSLFPKLSSL